MATTSALRTTATRPAEEQLDTRARVLRLVVEDGPVSAAELAGTLGLTSAGVRRHVAALEEDGRIAVHRTPRAAGRRGRPARRYVATDHGQSALRSSYADLSAQLMQHLADVLGPEAVAGFAARRAADLAARHTDAVAAAGEDPTDRAVALAAGLSEEGYAATARPVLRGRAVQLCQGHCPVRDVAAQFPELCEAETRMFSELLGVHVQRLSTLASGGHVCTTHIPTTSVVRAASDRPGTGTVEGTR